MKYYIKVEKDVKILVEDINFDLGNPIMFVHGWPLNHNMYEYIVEYFASRGHRCIAIDLRGYGNSDKPYTGYDYDRMAMDIKLVIDALKLSDITLVGHSMGGAICLRYMSKFNVDKVSRLCLLSAAAPKWVQSSNWPYGYTVDEVNKRLMAPLWSTVNSLRALRDEDVFNDLTNIKIPTLILHGLHDTVCPYLFAEYMNRTIKNSVLTPLTDGGHGAFYECKDEINKSLEAFIYNYLQ